MQLMQLGEGTDTRCFLADKASAIFRLETVKAGLEGVLRVFTEWLMCDWIGAEVCDT